MSYIVKIYLDSEKIPGWKNIPVALLETASILWLAFNSGSLIQSKRDKSSLMDFV